MSEMSERTSRSLLRPPAHPARTAAFIYTGISVAGAVAFILVTTFTGDYPLVARYGGAAWVFLLLMIVLMPIVIPRVQKWGGAKSAVLGAATGAATIAADTAAPTDDDMPVCSLAAPDTCTLTLPEAEAPESQEAGAEEPKDG